MLGEPTILGRGTMNHLQQNVGHFKGIKSLKHMAIFLIKKISCILYYANTSTFTNILLSFKIHHLKTIQAVKHAVLLILFKMQWISFIRINK